MKTPDKIHYSNDKVIVSPIIQIWEDLHQEAAGFFRAFWAESPEATSGSPVIGYCSPGGSHRTIREVASEVLRLYPDAKVFRNSRLVKI